MYFSTSYNCLLNVEVYVFHIIGFKTRLIIKFVEELQETPVFKHIQTGRIQLSLWLEPQIKLLI